MKVQYR